MPKRSNITRNIFDEISADDALAILRLLAKEDPKIANRIEQIAIEYLSGVDIGRWMRPRNFLDGSWTIGKRDKKELRMRS
jgi:hypothetical protein